MPEILRKSFQSDGGGALYGANYAHIYPEIKPENMVTFPNGEELYVSPPYWTLCIDVFDAKLTITGIGEAANLLHEELARFEPPQIFSDEEIAVSMPTGANHSKRGYNLRFTVSRRGIPPHIPHLDEFDKVDVIDRDPYYAFPKEPEMPHRQPLNTTPTRVDYLLD